MESTVMQNMLHIHHEIAKLNQEYIALWKEHMFLTGRWWINVALLLVPWIVWFIVRKKDSTNRLMLAGLFVYLITSVLDSMGVSFGLWFYCYTPLPYLHTFFLPWDFAAFPVFTMLLLQYKQHIHPYKKALFFALVSAVVAEPFFIWMEVYVPVHWKVYYGIPIYFLIYLLANRISKRHHFQQL